MKESPLEKTTRFKIGFLTMAIAGFFSLVWLADENIPGNVVEAVLWLSLILLPLLYFLHLKIRLNLFFGFMVLGIPLGISLSIVDLVNVLQTATDTDAIALGVATSLWLAFFGGFVSAIGYFGYSWGEPVKQRELRMIDCLIASAIILVVPAPRYIDFAPFLDVTSLGIFCSVFAMGIGLTKFKEMPVLSALPNIYVCVALLGAALSTIGFVSASLASDPKMAGPNMAIGLLTMLYGVNAYVLSFVLTLTTDDFSENLNLTTKNWHLVEGFMFLFFMTLGPQTLFEMLQNS
ncbi:hypothetical protein N8214_05985 [Pseudomonadales bacterium]|jgi:hypothetical protein|nr:hypothetical protein [Pseudomonadota bacterium]MDC1478945.1 hypothetical protein [Pseudomonadales bacterium]